MGGSFPGFSATPTPLPSIEEGRWRSPLCAVSLGNQVLFPGLSFPICEMKPWICFSSEALLALMLCGKTNRKRVRVERPIADLLGLPQGRRSYRGLGPHCAQGLVPLKEGGSQAKEGRSRGTRDCADKAVPSPLLFSLPPPLPGDSRAQQKINPKTVTWTGLRLPGRSSTKEVWRKGSQCPPPPPKSQVHLI